MSRRADREFGDYVAGRFPAVLHLAHLLTGDPQRAAELAEQALASTYRHWRVVRADGADEHVRAAVVRGLLGRRPALRRSRRPRDVTAAATAPAEPAADQGDQIDQADQADQGASAAVWRALGRLPARQRAAVVLRYAEELPDPAIAELLRTTPARARTLVAAGRAALAEQLPAAPVDRRDAPVPAATVSASPWQRPAAQR